ncbi:hypothetical protein BMF94_1634 [Rhodotorula taiwanensis]|uniref:Amino acid permease/ SLC12A domain-containing protein n=1 Tax=Rhodotorula taiwanensis TaxID=741276 RepID=A0A2S5BES4_9BASI|nr:hypothetical protein BMF94_1634 [Rhodotorula taiwanensis]
MDDFGKEDKAIVAAAVQPVLVSEDNEREEERLAALGYKQEFAREFTNLSTISFAFSIMGVASSVATTIDTPLLLGGPVSVVWCWFIGSFMCMCLGLSIAELISAYPTNGGLYSASAYLVPRAWRPVTGWTIGWLNILGQVAGVASTEWGLANMILAAASISTDGAYVATAGQTMAVYVALLVVHGLLNSVGTKVISSITRIFVFVNLGTVIAVVIALGVTCKDKHPASYVFTETVNQSGWPSNGFSVLLGLLSVCWTMTDYDATAHISEEVKKASIRAPVAIIIAVAGTGIFGWVYNIMFVLCSGPLQDLPGAAGYSAATIILRNVGLKGFYVLWTAVCFVAFAVVSTALQANARTVHAFSRDGGLPDRGFFCKVASNRVPINAVWIVCFVSALLGLLRFASEVAVNAVFSLCAIALDSSYAVPIACKLIFRHHPEVNFQPGPFALRGPLGTIIPSVAVVWVTFTVVVLAWPESLPITAETWNYSSTILGGVLLLTSIGYLLGGRRRYSGPRTAFEVLEGSMH